MIFAALKTGCPIVPVAYGAQKKWVFRGWDEFIVPKPFNRIAMVYGEPIRVGPGDPPDQKSRELQKALNAVSEEADRICGGGCCD